MFVSVYFLARLLAEARVPPTLSLAAEIVCGAVLYIVAAFALARPIVGELLSLVRGSRAARA
jgi:hypothetical protein